MGRTVYLEDPYVGPPLTKVIFTLGPQSQDVKTLEKLLRAGMTVAKFDTSESSEDGLQEGLANLRNAMASTHITCHVLLEKKKKSSRSPEVGSMKQPFCNIPEHASYSDTPIKETVKDMISTPDTTPMSDVASTKEVVEIVDKKMDKPVDGVVDSSPAGETITASITKELDALRVNLSKEIDALRASLSAGRQSFSSATLKSMLNDTGPAKHINSLLPIDCVVAQKSEVEAAEKTPSAVATANGVDSGTTLDGVRRGSAESTTGNIDTQKREDAVSKSAAEAATANIDIQKGEHESRRSSTNGNAKDMDTQKNLGSEIVQALDIDTNDKQEDATKDETAGALAPAGTESVQALDIDSNDKTSGVTEDDSTTIGALASAGSESVQANLVIDNPDKIGAGTFKESPAGSESIGALGSDKFTETVKDAQTTGALAPADSDSVGALGSDKITETVKVAQTTGALDPADSAGDQASVQVDSHDKSSAVMKDGLTSKGLKSYEVDSVGNMVVDGKPISPGSRKVNLVATSPVASPSKCFFSPFMTCCTTSDIVLVGTMRTNKEADDQKKFEAEAKQESGGTPGAFSMPEDSTIVPESKKRKLDAIDETATQVDTSSEPRSQKKTDAIDEASIDALPPTDEVGSLVPKTEKKAEVLSDLTVAPDATTTGQEVDVLAEESPPQNSTFDKKIDSSEEASVQALASAAGSDTNIGAVSSFSTTETTVGSAAEEKTTAPDATTGKKVDPIGESIPKPFSTESMTASSPTAISTEANVDATEEETSSPGLLNAGAVADAVVDHTQVPATPTPSMDRPIARDVPGIESLPSSTSQTKPAALVTHASSTNTSPVTAPSKPTKPDDTTNIVSTGSVKVVEAATPTPPYKRSYVSYGVLAKQFGDEREVTSSSNSVSQPSKDINPVIPASSDGDQAFLPPKIDPPPSQVKKMSISDLDSGRDPKELYTVFKAKHRKPEKFKDLESLLRILKPLRREGLEEISWKLP